MFDLNTFFTYLGDLIRILVMIAGCFYIYEAYLLQDSKERKKIIQRILIGCMFSIILIGMIWYLIKVRKIHYKTFLLSLIGLSSPYLFLAAYYEWEWFFFGPRMYATTLFLGYRNVRIYIFILSMLFAILVTLEVYAIYTGWDYPYREKLWECAKCKNNQ